MRRKRICLFGIILLVMSLLAGCMVTLDTPEERVSQANKEQIKGTEDKEGKEDPESETQSDQENIENDRENIENKEETQDKETLHDTENALDTDETETEQPSVSGMVETGEYTSKEEVAEYLHLFGHLPDNFITKKEAKALGWVSKEGNLGEVAPGKSIGGDYFGNYEGSLPEKEGRSYYECDIDSDGSYRGSKRIVFSDDGLVYYTEDHYETFELLYGEE